MVATRLGMSTDSEDVPQTAKEGKPITAQTPSSVHEDSEKAMTGRMPLTSERSVSQVQGSESWKGRMSGAKDGCPERGTLWSRIGPKKGRQHGEDLRRAAMTGCLCYRERTRRSSDNFSMKGSQSHLQ